MAYRARAAEGITSRDVEPLGIVFYGGAWYLVAWCRLRNDIRHFRVDRVQHLEALAETFPVRADFSLKQHLEARPDREEREPARIWLSNRAIERARAESWATLIEELRRDGGAEFTLFTFSLPWLARWLLAFGAEAEALEPVKLRELVCEQAESVLERYRVLN
jgi:predicted DNA-binding transcriptional regulator YafY